ncbi:DUF6153 family protein [Streptomyces sp. NPDC058646]|uniref:DUF6153 family protein n=1 Tax=Streptomyces sp. NPDC058646 TaxID=3346574 RepID=UPI003648C4D8
MIAAVPRTRPRPAGPGFVLLVLAVLAGVLAMHGLGPRPVPVAAPPSVHAAHPAAHATHLTACAAQPAAERHGGTDRSVPAGAPEHLAHADGTCAAAGVGSAYVPPPLVASVDEALPGGAPPGAAPAAAYTGRAPPDLAELQLLRI